MKLKKVIALLLASVMSVSILAACGSNNDGAATTPSTPSTDTTSVGTVDEAAVEEITTGYVPWNFSPDNPVTISIWTVTNSGAPSADNIIHQLLLDELGVTLDMEMTTTDNQDMRISTMLAGGVYPDLIGSTHNDALMTAGGAYLRLDDYLASGNWPLLREHVEPHLRRLSYRAGEVEDGFYQFPNYNRWYGPEIKMEDWSAPAFWIQMAVLEDAGYPSLDGISLDEYFELIENYAAKYPTIDGVPTIGFTLDFSEGRQWSVTNNALQLQGGANWGGAFPDLHTGEVRHYITDDYARRWAHKLMEINQKGLLDPECFTATADQFQSRLASGAVLGFPHQRWAFSQAQDSLRAEDRRERTYVPVMPTFDNIPPHYSTGQLMNIHQGYGISVDAAAAGRTEMLLDFLELMMTEKWQKILFWGIEGQDYLVGDDGLYYRTQDMRDEQHDPIWQQANQARAFRDNLPKRQGLWPDGNADSAGFQRSEFFAGLTEYEQNFLKSYNKLVWADFFNDAYPTPSYYPIWQLHGMLSNDANLANVQLDEVQYPAFARLALATPDTFDGLWDDFLAQVALIDTQLYLDEINALIDDIVANE
ncbi:MAG: ABC transporter substrate-binding protein [Lachnospiraceae bacterium]|nr:ABC transporter substrate-binding protein [Lachnospiraceae bacterium]